MDIREAVIKTASDDAFECLRRFFQSKTTLELLRDHYETGCFKSSMREVAEIRYYDKMLLIMVEKFGYSMYRAKLVVDYYLENLL